MKASKKKSKKGSNSKKPTVIVSMHGGLVESVYIDDRRLKGARVIVTERPDEAEGEREEVYVKGGQLDGELLYSLSEVEVPTQATVRAATDAADEYEAKIRNG